MTLLSDILENKRREVSDLKKNKPLSQLARCFDVRNFKDALQSEEVSIIAEIKLRSPSGEWCKNVSPVKIARVFEKSRASAISVLTDKKFFHGDIRFIPEVKKYTKKPVLRKDFIIDEYQVHEAFLYGADAVLLIVSILSDDEIKNFVEIIEKLGMDCVVECRTGEEVERVNRINNEINDLIEIYGINNRNLETMEIDLNTTKKLIKKIPKGKIIVSESGIKDKCDIEFLKNSGASAALVGTSIMLSDDIVKKIDELLPF